MSRRLRTTLPNPWLLSAVLLLPFAALGCSVLATGMWVLSPNDRTAEFDGLKHKRVAVVCKTNIQDTESVGVDGELADQIAALLKQHVSKIVLVPQADVTDWMDHNDPKSYVDLGKALKVDKVVAVELEQFSLYQGRTVYQGHAQGSIAVHDVATGDVAPLAPLDAMFPPKNGVAIDMSEREFRAKFVMSLANRVARRFYSHDSRDIDDDYYGD